MITLHGSPISNYYNKVKLALLEKCVPFNEALAATHSSDEAILGASPLGKIPFITTEQGAQIFGSDSGVLVPNGDGTASFVTTVQIVGGTRQYAHATGSFVAPGTLNLVTGDTVGTYSATICLGVGAP